MAKQDKYNGVMMIIECELQSVTLREEAARQRSDRNYELEAELQLIRHTLENLRYSAQRV
jgi:hypothetical protein